jgi:hypothetical protein
MREQPEDFKRLKDMTKDAQEREFCRTKNPPPPKWEFEGDEAALIAQFGEA